MVLRQPSAPVCCIAHHQLRCILHDPILAIDGSIRNTTEFRGPRRALSGFNWGFSIHNATFTYEPPAALAPSVWDGHRAFLAREHPSRAFVDGYRSHQRTLPPRSDPSLNVIPELSCRQACVS